MHLPTFAQALVPLTAPYLLATPGVNDPNFQKAVLSTHNSDRAKHGVPALTWDPNLAQFAQKWANNCEFKHSGGPHGENLHGLWTTGPFDAIESTKSGIHGGWYSEIKNYDFNKPGFASGTGHFTQMVWKNTKKVGCAWNTVPCKSNGMAFYKLVCEYDPRGNIVGDNGKWFKENVPRPVKTAGVEMLGQDDGQEKGDSVEYPIHFEEVGIEEEEVAGFVVEL